MIVDMPVVAAIKGLASRYFGPGEYDVIVFSNGRRRYAEIRKAGKLVLGDETLPGLQKAIERRLVEWERERERARVLLAKEHPWSK